MSYPTAMPARPAEVTESPVPGSTGPVERAPGTEDTTTPVISQDLLVEEVSIDGMCGVY
jgi:mycofactocin precursor